MVTESWTLGWTVNLNHNNTSPLFADTHKKPKCVRIILYLLSGHKRELLVIKHKKNIQFPVYVQGILLKRDCLDLYENKHRSSVVNTKKSEIHLVFISSNIKT